MSLFSMLKDCVITHHMNAVAAGTSDQTSAAAIDMAGYDGCLFICDLGTVTDNSVLTLTAYEVATNAVTGGTAVSGGATAAATAATSSNKLLLVDVVKPSKRYLYVTLNRTTQNAVINCMIAIRYKAKAKPVTVDTTVLASALSTPEV